MRNILLFAIRNHVFLLFLLLEGIAVALTVRNNAFHGVSWFQTTNVVTGGVHSVRGGISEYFRLSVVNRELAEENALLRGMLRQSQYVSADSCDAVAVHDSIYRQHYTYIAGSIVRFTVNRQANHMTIDRGRLEGVRAEMGVIANGVVAGVVRSVSDNFADVLPIIHRSSSISARLRDNGYFGALKWDGRNPMVAQLHDIPVHVKLRPGMVVETSGLSAMFPEGIAIGIVMTTDNRSGDNFHHIDVELSSDPRTWKTVYVVNNLMREEQQALESQQTDR